jgi:hypothetical protein
MYTYVQIQILRTVHACTYIRIHKCICIRKRIHIHLQQILLHYIYINVHM